MSNDIHGAIKEGTTSKAVSKEVRDNARKLGKFVGTKNPIPKKLENSVLAMKSTSNVATIMKKYVKSK